MPKHNKNFELTINDIDLIEAALHVTMRDLSMQEPGGRQEMMPGENTDETLRKIDDLLGRLHNQKVFYRPTKGTYLGG